MKGKKQGTTPGVPRGKRKKDIHETRYKIRGKSGGVTPRKKQKVEKSKYCRIGCKNGKEKVRCDCGGQKEGSDGRQM